MIIRGLGLHLGSRLQFFERQLGKEQFILNSEMKWKVIDRVDQNALYCFEN